MLRLEDRPSWALLTMWVGSVELLRSFAWAALKVQPGTKSLRGRTFSAAFRTSPKVPFLQLCAAGPSEGGGGLLSSGRQPGQRSSERTLLCGNAEQQSQSLHMEPTRSNSNYRKSKAVPRTEGTGTGRKNGTNLFSGGESATCPPGFLAAAPQRGGAGAGTAGQGAAQTQTPALAPPERHTC